MAGAGKGPSIPSGNPNGGPNGTGTGTGDGSNMAGGVGTSPVIVQPTWRLTNVEYANTVHDFLGFTPTVPARPRWRRRRFQRRPRSGRRDRARLPHVGHRHRGQGGRDAEPGPVRRHRDRRCRDDVRLEVHRHLRPQGVSAAARRRNAHRAQRPLHHRFGDVRLRLGHPGGSRGDVAVAIFSLPPRARRAGESAPARFRSPVTRWRVASRTCSGPRCPTTRSSPRPRRVSCRTPIRSRPRSRACSPIREPRPACATSTSSGCASARCRSRRPASSPTSTRRPCRPASSRRSTRRSMPRCGRTVAA